MLDLKEYQDLKYKAFQEKICNTSYPIIGIRIPLLRKLSKKITISDLNGLPLSYEKVLLEGMLISKSEDKKQFIDNYISKIESWSVCDIFCSNLGFIKSNLDEYYDYLLSLLKTNDEFKVRFAIVVFLKYYITDKYIDEIIHKLVKIKYHAYYSDMAIAWFLAEAYYYFPSIVDENIGSFSLEIQKKAKQKMKESIKVCKNNIN